MLSSGRFLSALVIVVAQFSDILFARFIGTGAEIVERRSLLEILGSLRRLRTNGNRNQGNRERVACWHALKLSHRAESGILGREGVYS